MEQGKIKTVSVLGFSDVGMVKSLYVDRDGVLWLSFANIEGAYTAAIDPSGDEAKIVGETQPGYLIGPAPDLICLSSSRSRTRRRKPRAGARHHAVSERPDLGPFLHRPSRPPPKHHRFAAVWSDRR